MSDQIAKLAEQLKNLRNTGKRKKYPTKIQDQVIELINEGVSLQDLSTGLGIHLTTLSGWKNKNRLEQRTRFQKASLVDDHLDIKVTIICGLKVSDLGKIF